MDASNNSSSSGRRGKVWRRRMPATMREATSSPSSMRASWTEEARCCNPKKGEFTVLIRLADRLKSSLISVASLRKSGSSCRISRKIWSRMPGRGGISIFSRMDSTFLYNSISDDMTSPSTSLRIPEPLTVFSARIFRHRDAGRTLVPVGGKKNGCPRAAVLAGLRPLTSARAGPRAPACREP